MPFYSRKYKQIRSDFRFVCDPQDKYGSAIEYLFSIADFLYHAGATIPIHWDYRHAHGCTQHYPAFEWTSDIIWLHVDYHISLEDITLFGNVLFRYLSVLRLAGEAY